MARSWQRSTAEVTHPYPNPSQLLSSQPPLLAQDSALWELFQSLSLWAASQLENTAAASPPRTGLPLCSGASSNRELPLPGRLLGGSRTETLLSALPCLLHQPPQLQSSLLVPWPSGLNGRQTPSLQGPPCAVLNSKTPTHYENKFGGLYTCLGVFLPQSIAPGAEPFALLFSQ